MMKQNKLLQKAVVKNDGFTLVELLVVLAIIALIATIATPQVIRYLGSARVDVAKTQMRNIQGALELLYLETGRYPTSEEGVEVLVKPVQSFTPWSGPYIKPETAIIDPWGNTYVYKGPENTNSFTLLSYGRDGIEGGEGLDADITP